MPREDDKGDDLILERLREAVSGDAPMRQLRKRYEALRRDYEGLLGRLTEIEARLNAIPSAAAPRERLEPGMPARTVPGAGKQGPVSDDLVAPLLRLRDEYLGAIGGIQAIVNGLESLAAGALKGQHGPESTSPSTEIHPPRPREMRVEVRGHGFGELLDFQERLSEIAGVARVSIHAIDNERASLVVELEGAEAE